MVLCTLRLTCLFRVRSVAVLAFRVVYSWLFVLIVMDRDLRRRLRVLRLVRRRFLFFANAVRVMALLLRICVLVVRVMVARVLCALRVPLRLLVLMIMCARGRLIRVKRARVVVSLVIRILILVLRWTSSLFVTVMIRIVGPRR